MQQYYIVHSRNGRLVNDTDEVPSIQNLDNLIQQLKDDPRDHLVVHFHGGLVKKSAAISAAKRLSESYSKDSLPAFFVWESGFIETMRNNFLELAEEPVFKQLVRKLIEYTLGRIGAESNSRSIAPGSVDPREVKNAIDEYWATQSKDRVPYVGYKPNESEVASRSAVGVDESEIQADLEADTEFAAALATLPDLKPGTRSALFSGNVKERKSLFSEAVADRVSEQPGTRGLVAWYKVAKLVAKILVKVLRRYSEGRDHGLYATVVEEIVREIKLGGSGINEWAKALQWNRMKQDTEEAFGAKADCAGTVLLMKLAEAISTAKKPKRITLIGHSTGAIYIAHWLAAADKLLPDGIKFDVIFLAPAITYELFDATLTKHGKRIANIRMFAMSDSNEREDQVWGEDFELEGGKDWRSFIYPSSLLYLVSGILESTKDASGNAIDVPDMPLVGLQRHFNYDVNEFADIGRVRQWLVSIPGSTVWSITKDQPPGYNCASIDHGGFNHEEITLASIVSLLEKWK